MANMYSFNDSTTRPSLFLYILTTLLIIIVFLIIQTLMNLCQYLGIRSLPPVSLSVPGGETPVKTRVLKIATQWNRESLCRYAPLPASPLHVCFSQFMGFFRFVGFKIHTHFLGSFTTYLNEDPCSVHTMAHLAQCHLKFGKI